MKIGSKFSRGFRFTLSQLDKSFFDQVSHYFYLISLLIMCKVTHLIFTMEVH